MCTPHTTHMICDARVMVKPCTCTVTRVMRGRPFHSWTAPMSARRATAGMRLGLVLATVELSRSQVSGPLPSETRECMGYQHPCSNGTRGCCAPNGFAATTCYNYAVHYTCETILNEFGCDCSGCCHDLLAPPPPSHYPPNPPFSRPPKAPRPLPQPCSFA